MLRLLSLEEKGIIHILEYTGNKSSPDLHVLTVKVATDP